MATHVDAIKPADPPRQDLSQGLQQFVRQHYPQGLKWNAGGCSVAEAQKQVAAAGGGPAPAPAAGGKAPPPPPPVPPVELLLKERPGAAAEKSGGGGAMSGVFAQLSQVGRLDGWGGGRLCQDLRQVAGLWLRPAAAGSLLAPRAADEPP